MKKNHPRRRHQKNLNKGWTTIETLYSLPILAAAIVLAVYLGMLVYTKIMLGQATNAAVQVLAKTGECGDADAYFNANFMVNGQAQTSCDAGSDVSTYSASYDYNDIQLLLFSIPPAHLTSVSKAVTEIEK